MGNKSGVKTAYQTGIAYWLVIIFIASFVFLIGYISLYLPLTSYYFGEINFDSQNNISIKTKANTQIYYEFDTSSYVKDGTKIKVTITDKNNWSIDKTYTIAEKNNHDNVNSSTILVSPMGQLPRDGEYKILFNQLDKNTNIRKIRIYGK